MTITVALWGQLKQKAGVGEVALEVGGDTCTVEGVVRQLASESDEAVARILIGSDGAVRESTLVFRGDQQVPSLAETLADGESITLMSPIAGG